MVPLRLLSLLFPFKINVKNIERLEDECVAEIDNIFINKTKL